MPQIWANEVYLKRASGDHLAPVVKLRKRNLKKSILSGHPNTLIYGISIDNV